MGFSILLIIWIHYNNLKALQVFSIVILFLSWWFQKESSQMELQIKWGSSLHVIGVAPTASGWIWPYRAWIALYGGASPCCLALQTRLHFCYLEPIQHFPHRWSSGRHQNVSIGSWTSISWMIRGEAPLLCIKDFINHPRSLISHCKSHATPFNSVTHIQWPPQKSLVKALVCSLYLHMSQPNLIRPAKKMERFLFLSICEGSFGS